VFPPFALWISRALKQSFPNEVRAYIPDTRLLSLAQLNHANPVHVVESSMQELLQLLKQFGAIIHECQEPPHAARVFRDLGFCLEQSSHSGLGLPGPQSDAKI